MKKIIPFTLIFLSGAGMAHAQNIPFPANGAVWKEAHTTIAGPILRHYALCGDTTINAITYSKVVELQLDSTGQVSETAYVGAIRSGGPIVRFIADYEVEENVLFDFSLEAGDTIQVKPWFGNFPIGRTVDSVKTENLAGQLRKVIYFHPGYEGAPVEFWMEGIGSSYGLTGRAFDPGADIGFSLLCFQHGSTYLNLTLIECFLPEVPDCGFSNSTEKLPLPVTVSPNPSGADIKVSLPADRPVVPWHLVVFDAVGRKVSTIEPQSTFEAIIRGGSLAPGTYFLSIEEKHTGRKLAHAKVIVLRS
ncbi:MAG: T9SS type A sorting domain-containing protein [Saprospiraceae bacterium]